MTVFIQKNEDGRYKWIVSVGRGRGSVIKSRHHKKARAKSKARKIAKKRGEKLKEQMNYGTWRTVKSY